MRIPLVLPLVAVMLAVGAGAVAQEPGVTISRGTTVMPNSWTWSIETNQIGGGELWWTGGGELHCCPTDFKPARDQLALAVVRGQMFDNIDLAYLQRVAFTAQKLPRSEISAGTIIALRTGSGHLAKLRVVRFFRAAEVYPEPQFSSKEHRNTWLEEKRGLAAEGGRWENYHVQIEWVLFRPR